METKGIEQSLLKTPKSTISKKSGAKCGARDDKNAPDLVQLVRDSLELPEDIKSKIIALIQTHTA